jgi:alkylhydroperoxidase/carboxymuconolactone decarboxylase family protein YurZ
MAKSLDARRQQLKDDFMAAGGDWSDVWAGVLELSPEYFAAYIELAAVPWRHGTLAPKVREVIHIAVDAATTHLFAPGTRLHIARALRHGASTHEIMEVLMMSSVLGVHAITQSLPLLISVMKEAGRDPKIGEAPLAAAEAALKDEFIKTRGYWAPIFDALLHFSPAFFKAYTDFSSVPWRHGTLEPKIRELVYIAIDASTTHLYGPGTRVHMANALRQGATPAEIMEVLMLISALGVHTMAVGVPALLDEARKFRGAAQKDAGARPSRGKARSTTPRRAPAGGRGRGRARPRRG